MMRNCRQRLMWLLLFAILLAVPAYSEQSVVLEIPAVIYTNKGTLRLGEIARITGGSRKVRDAIANIQVWNDGQTLDRREVMRAIEDSDVSDVRLEIRMPLSSRIETPDYEGNFTDTSPSPSRSLNDLVPMLKEMSGWKGGIEISANSPIPEGTATMTSSAVMPFLARRL